VQFFEKSANPLQTILNSLMMSLNPISPINAMIFFIIMCITSVHVLERDIDGSLQWSKAAKYTLPLYLLIAVVINSLVLIYI
jgi:hypothetical protein